MGLALGLFTTTYLWLSHFGFDLLEGGYFLSFARRVQLGGVPYRDFATP